MATATERRIQDDATGGLSQHLENLIHHYGSMVESDWFGFVLVSWMIQHGPSRRADHRCGQRPTDSSFDRPPTSWRPSGCLPESD